MRIKYMHFPILLLAGVFILGCSNGSGAIVTTPDADIPQSRDTTGSSHASWGIWQFTADPVAQTLDCVQLRAANMHLNALPFLEPPPLVYLTLETLEFNGNIIETDIGLKHPFLGLVEFTGFDVCGILFTNGTNTGYGDGIVMAGSGDTYLLNPDGYSRWWNPDEFPNNGTMLGYTDGLLGTKDSAANYNCNINAYKYFADTLESNDDLSLLPLSSRGQFSAGEKNIRHYTIELGTAGVVFNYAVDACWKFPDGTQPWQAPDSFAKQANRPEPYRISASVVENLLYYEDSTSNAGGTAQILVDVYDWFDGGLNTLDCRMLCGIPPVTGLVPIGGGDGYSTYQIDLDGSSLTQNGDTDLLLICRSDAVGYQDLLPGETVSSYFTFPITISGESTETGWARTWGGGPDTADWGRGVTADDWGNIYATGTFRGTVDFDPGDGIDQHSSSGSSDIFLSKFDSEGNYQWVAIWGGGGSEDVRTPSVDSNGDIYLAARSSGNGVLLKHDSNGAFEWARSWGGPVWTRACDVDDSDNIYITGFYSGTVDFDPDDIDEEERTAVMYEDIFLSKFDTDGDFLWVLSWGGNDKDEGHAVCADGSDYVYAGGGFRSSSVDFDPDPVGEDTQSSHGVYDCYVVKFDSTGDFVWANTWGGGGNDQTFDIGVDDSGYTYITGYAGGGVDYDPGPGVYNHSGMAWLSKFDSSGDFQWACAWGSTCYGYNLDLHGSDYIYISGTFRYTIDFDPGPGTWSRSSNGSTDSYVTKFNSNGDHQWAQTWGWAGAFDAAYDVAADNAGNAYAEGYFGGNTDFDPTEEGEDWHDTNGSADVYLLKLLPDGGW